MKKIKKVRRLWEAFRRAEVPLHYRDKWVEYAAGEKGLSEEEAGRIWDEDNSEVYVNNFYQVCVRRGIHPEKWPELIHLSVKRRDKGPVEGSAFRDFMRIKDEIVGPENEGCEILPAQSRLHDSANQYHFWIFADPKVRWPFGFLGRCVTAHPPLGARQRPFEDDYFTCEKGDIR
ncbi:MAG: hypothetical protein C0402_05290 [Thermodesulfovibrio sp.]|nr:hypothetical protein [Thermodesulfovibrio sp.]